MPEHGVDFGRRQCSAPVLTEQVVDTVGAGDTFQGAFVCGSRVMDAFAAHCLHRILSTMLAFSHHGGQLELSPTRMPAS